MPGLPPHIAARRARRRAERRRRRMAAVAGLLVVAAVLFVVLEAASGTTTNPSATTSARNPHAARGTGPRRSGRSARAGRSGAATAAGEATIARLVRLGLPIYCAGTHGNEIALTFDDGPGPYTYLALKKLRQARERATFFDVGRSIDDYPGYLRREARIAAIGDHTYTHPELPALSPSQITWQLQATAEKISAGSGERVNLFRPPYELRSPTVDGIVQHLGLLDILWDVDSRDSLGANYAQIITNVEAGLRPGAIIELHENHGQTIRALTTLLPELHRRHLRSVSIPELLATDPPTEAQVRRGPAGCASGGKLRGTGAE